MNYVIGCDVGSQGVKVILLTAEGQLAGEASVGYGIDYPAPTWAEQNVYLWTDAMCQAVRKAVTAIGVTPEQITAIGLDAQVDGVVLIDASGNPLRPAIIWMDRRAVTQCNTKGISSHRTEPRCFAHRSQNPLDCRQRAGCLS
jgi:xylulokinase